jgi:hypothetical protein|tara:strand:+ start:222 stop:449 length:228 start_codon:yes stop_codon:yes gene_type:complete
MEEKGRKRVRKAIDKAAKNLEGKLPQSSKHPKGRNPYAHIPKVIISVFGKSYTELPDSEINMVLEVIRYCEKYPF